MIKFALPKERKRVIEMGINILKFQKNYHKKFNFLSEINNKSTAK